MKTPLLHSPRFVRVLPAVCAFLISAAVAAHAQSVLAPTAPVVSSPSPGQKEKGRSLSGISSALASGVPLIQRGPIAIRPHLHYRFTHGDGIEAGPGNQRETTIHAITPGVLAEIGKYWNLSYTSTWTFYSDRFFRDTVGQSASLAGRYVFDDWMVGVMQAYDSTYATLVETGRQTHQVTHGTTVEGAYKLGSRTSLDASISRSQRDANAVTDAPEWTTSDWLQYSSSNWLRYHFSPRLSVAAGIMFGLAELSIGDDMKFTQPQIQIAWQPTGKITLSAQGGVERRQFENGNEDELETPVYSGTFSYQPVTTTKLFASASHSVSASYFANEITEGRGWTAGIEQRLLRRLFLEVSHTENHSRYVATRELGTARRDDRYHSWHARLSTVLFGRTAVGIFFQTGRNSSDVAAYEFSSTQFGFDASHRF